MGKKKPQKTEELSVAIAEASSTGEGDRIRQQQPQVQTPRKRGRPRKIVESEDNGDQEAAAQVHQKEVTDDEQSQSKKLQTSKEEQDVRKAEAPSASMDSVQKKGGQSIVGEPSKEPPRSRARRKSKPRKSS